MHGVSGCSVLMKRVWVGRRCMWATCRPAPMRPASRSSSTPSPAARYLVSLPPFPILHNAPTHEPFTRLDLAITESMQGGGGFLILCCPAASRTCLVHSRLSLPIWGCAAPPLAWPTPAGPASSLPPALTWSAPAPPGQVTKVVIPPARADKPNREFGFVHFGERAVVEKLVADAEKGIKPALEGNTLEVRGLLERQAYFRTRVAHSWLAAACVTAGHRLAWVLSSFCALAHGANAACGPASAAPCLIAFYRIGCPLGLLESCWAMVGRATACTVCSNTATQYRYVVEKLCTMG